MDLLEEFSYQVSWLRNGIEAQDLLLQETHGVDLMLLNFSLGELSGLDVLKTLRAHGKTIPIMMMSAYYGVGQQCLDAGADADAFLNKPFKVDDLINEVKTLLLRHEI